MGISKKDRTYVAYPTTLSLPPCTKATCTVLLPLPNLTSLTTTLASPSGAGRKNSRCMATVSGWSYFCKVVRECSAMAFHSRENRYPPWATVPQEKCGWTLIRYSCVPSVSMREACSKVVGGRDMVGYVGLMDDWMGSKHCSVGDVMLFSLTPLRGSSRRAGNEQEAILKSSVRNE